MDQTANVQSGIIGAWRQSSHPIVILSHVGIKIISIVFIFTYLFDSVFTVHQSGCCGFLDREKHKRTISCASSVVE
jgi:hypothetical protein